jgi:hypothetical protein
MSTLDGLELWFVIFAFFFQIVLIAHFSLRRWAFRIAIRYGWIVYLLGIPAALLSILLLATGKAWSFWIGGFIYFIWAVYGYTVEYIQKIQWRSPIRWPIFGPYILLYLATIMFYWWPLALLWKPLWYIYAVLFITSTVLNVSSHQPSQNRFRSGNQQI